MVVNRILIRCNLIAVVHSSTFPHYICSPAVEMGCKAGLYVGVYSLVNSSACPGTGWRFHLQSSHAGTVRSVLDITKNLCGVSLFVTVQEDVSVQVIVNGSRLT